MTKCVSNKMITCIYFPRHTIICVILAASLLSLSGVAVYHSSSWIISDAWAQDFGGGADYGGYSSGDSGGDSSYGENGGDYGGYSSGDSGSDVPDSGTGTTDPGCGVLIDCGSGDNIGGGYDWSGNTGTGEDSSGTTDPGCGVLLICASSNGGSGSAPNNDDVNGGASDNGFAQFASRNSGGGPNTGTASELSGSQGESVSGSTTTRPVDDVPSTSDHTITGDPDIDNSILNDDPTMKTNSQNDDMAGKTITGSKKSDESFGIDSENIPQPTGKIFVYKTLENYIDTVDAYRSAYRKLYGTEPSDDRVMKSEWIREQFPGQDMQQLYQDYKRYKTETDAGPQLFSSTREEQEASIAAWKAQEQRVANFQKSIEDLGTMESSIAAAGAGYACMAFGCNPAQMSAAINMGSALGGLGDSLGGTMEHKNQLDALSHTVSEQNKDSGAEIGKLDPSSTSNEPTSRTTPKGESGGGLAFGSEIIPRGGGPPERGINIEPERILNEGSYNKGTSPERATLLGTDPAKGNKYDPYEGRVGAEIENNFGGFERSPHEGAEWISLSGPYKGKTFDLLGLPDKAVPYFQSNPNMFEKNYLSPDKNGQNTVDGHFHKSVDYVILDTRNMTPEQASQIIQYIYSKYDSQLNRLIILR